MPSEGVWYVNRGTFEDQQRRAMKARRTEARRRRRANRRKP